MGEPELQLLRTGSADAPDREHLDCAFRERLRIPERAELCFTASGRTAFELALRVLKRRADASRRQVIIPGYSCKGLFDPIVASGLDPVFVEIDPDLLPDAEDVVRSMSAETLAVVAVHLCGKRFSAPAVFTRARQLGIAIIADECQSFGSWPRFGRPEEQPDFEIYSFGLGKSIIATAGGALIAHRDQEIVRAEAGQLAAEPAADITARCADALQRYAGDENRPPSTPVDEFEYDRLSPYAFRALSDVDAALLQRQLAQADEIVEAEMRNGRAVAATVNKHPAVYRPLSPLQHVFCKCSVVLHNEHLFWPFHSFLLERGIETENMYTPLHVRDFGRPYATRPLPASEALPQRVWNVPVRANLSAAQVARVVAAVDEFGRGHA